MFEISLWIPVRYELSVRTVDSSRPQEVHGLEKLDRVWSLAADIPCFHLLALTTAIMTAIMITAMTIMIVTRVVTVNSHGEPSKW